METTYENPGLPFTYDKSVSMNKWKETYDISVECTDFTVDGKTDALTFSADCMDKIICPDTEMFSKRDSFAGTYQNPFTGEEELTLHFAAYEPETLSGDEKNPLIIWLHGMGEGGKDPDIAILGNEVSALAKDEIQSHFSSGYQTGAYVLVVQTETYWMDEGDYTSGNITGSGESLYQEILMGYHSVLCRFKSRCGSKPDLCGRLLQRRLYDNEYDYSLSGLFRGGLSLL